jgi:tetratricopeptide (TPR) repeat protein
MSRFLAIASILWLAQVISITGQSVPDEIAALNQKIATAMKKKDLDAAANHARDAIVRVEAHYGPDSRHTALSYENLGTILAADGKYKAAIEPLEKALNLFRKETKQNARDLIGVISKLGDAQVRAGRVKEAESTLLEFRDGARDQFGLGSSQFLDALLASACFYQRVNQDLRAMDELVEAYALAIEKFGRNSPEMDRVGTGCEGTLMDLFWANQKRFDPARRKLDGLLGYELGRPLELKKADFPVSVPWKARDVGLHFAVVKVWIDENGQPTDAKLVYGRESLASLATSAAKGSRFRPSMKAGKPIPDVLFYSYTFIR